MSLIRLSIGAVINRAARGKTISLARSVEHTFFTSDLRTYLSHLVSLYCKLVLAKLTDSILFISSLSLYPRFRFSSPDL